MSQHHAYLRIRADFPGLERPVTQDTAHAHEAGPGHFLLAPFWHDATNVYLAWTFAHLSFTYICEHKQTTQLPMLLLNKCTK